MEYDKLKIKQKRNKGAKCQAEKRRLWFCLLTIHFREINEQNIAKISNYKIEKFLFDDTILKSTTTSGCWT